jgi:rRNA maturation endonuclease Nob1
MASGQIESVFVLDTSALIEIKHLHSRQKLDAWTELSELVNEKRLVFPREVIQELQVYCSEPGRPPDEPLEWAIKHKKDGVRTTRMNDVKALVEELPFLNDPRKREVDADYHVLALALSTRRANSVVVVTEDRTDTSSKQALATACGLKRIPVLTTRAMLYELGVLEDTLR